MPGWGACGIEVGRGYTDKSRSGARMLFKNAEVRRGRAIGRCHGRAWVPAAFLGLPARNGGPRDIRRSMNTLLHVLLPMLLCLSFGGPVRQQPLDCCCYCCPIECCESCPPGCCDEPCCPECCTPGCCSTAPAAEQAVPAEKAGSCCGSAPAEKPAKAEGGSCGGSGACCETAPAAKPVKAAKAAGGSCCGG